MDYWLACHEFKPSTAEDPPYKKKRGLKISGVKKTLSGSQKRKIRKEKEYNINSKYGKLDNFLISASSSSWASASSSNARELDEQILEVKINPHEKNTVSDTSTNKDTLSKEKESENENEETKLIRNDFAHYVGTPIDADLREQILKLGPYQPEGNFQKDAKGRSFSSSYYSFISKSGQKIERKWLCYSTRLHIVYCQVKTPLHPEKLTVWCALWAGGIIGPYFFKNDEGHNVTVNGDRYRAIINNFFIPELNNHDVQELWFQQDGATCHTARATMDLLKDTFGDRLISRFGPVNWPPKSCDLTPLDYFLWGYVKSLVYADKPQTLDHLEDNIRRVIADIRPQMEKVIVNWTSRLDYIRASRGSPVPEIIFKM
ncbi:putative transposable element [Trichonephila clavipes]|uniref:Putative transposable element n=1 Tax=Trichonephila clavipes TaxID=2585209 RepID=A0A8X7BKJ3_TRICX|nr:putative transposable element [Trichonephila clavipes]